MCSCQLWTSWVIDSEWISHTTHTHTDTHKHTHTDTHLYIMLTTFHSQETHNMYTSQ